MASFGRAEEPHPGVGKGSCVLKINVSKIPEGGMNLRFEKDGAWFLERLQGDGECDYVAREISVACTASRLKETVFIEGTVEATLEVPCCRCLEMTLLPIKSSFKYTFAPSPAQEEQEERELTAEDLDFAYYVEDTIDLDSLIFEQIMLQIPIKSVCAETCKGLCPHCGINLNTASCQCRVEKTDERLAALKAFRIRSEK